MKTYVIDVRYYIPAKDNDEFNRVLEEANINNSEYYGGYTIEDIEEEEDGNFLKDLLMEQQEQM